jgi:hypothetical protein
MKTIELKKTSLVIIPYTAAVIGLIVLTCMGKATWQELVGGLVLLNVPAAFGMAKAGDKDDAGKRDVPPPPVVLPLLLASALAAAPGAAACGYGKTACAVVDVAHANCDLWIRYLAEDGTTKEVRIPKEEANEMGRAAARREAAQKQDAGAP